MTSKNDFDSLQRFIFESCDIRGEIVTLNTSFIEACEHQSLAPGEKANLGEFLAAVALLGDTLKFDGVLTLQARGDGVIPLLMADITHQKSLRGIIKKQAGAMLDNVQTSLATLLGNSVLSITIDPEKGERYQGIIPLEGENIAACLTDYFTQSEQLPSWFLFYSTENFCGGLFLQALPKKVISDHDATKDAWRTATQFAATLKAEELFSIGHEEILYRLFHELGCKVFPAKKITFGCSCNEDRSSNAIAALGKEDAFNLLKEQGEIEINCEFCGKQFRFDEEKLQGLFGVTH